MNRGDLIRNLEEYHTDFLTEQKFIPKFLDLLSYPNCYERSLTFGHITASAWITNKSLNKVLLLHHAKLDRWLQPGGHADGDEDVIAVAKKELTEETGLRSLRLYNKKIFDLDIHTIPERKGIPEHDHYDVRFHFIAKYPEEISKNDESHELKWIPNDEVLGLVDHEESFERMLSKNEERRLKLVQV
ncbi:MAG: NUDIX hydrolase [Cyclobacteriaceae bacterium]